MELDTVELWFDEEDKVQQRIERRQIRDRSNIMELSDKSFVQNFRLTKDAFLYLLNSIDSELKVPCRRTAVPNIIKLSATLKFLGTGGYQLQIGEDRYTGLAQQTMSTIISDVCRAIEKMICPKHINFVMSEEEKKNAKKYFWEKSGIPGIIGAEDGTHIQTIRPIKNEHLFFNRELKHSINAMVICDHLMTIRSVNGRYGGASHDSHIWSLSDEREFLRRRFENGYKTTWIICDSGYPLEPWILTPYRTASENSAEYNFNSKFSAARLIIERVFGVLKARFRCLLSARELHCSPEKATRILNVCCALHNICSKYKVDMPIAIQADTEQEDDSILSSFNIHSIAENRNLSNATKATRDQIRNNLLP